MARETQSGLGSFLVDKQDGDRSAPLERLVGLERAYHDVLERLRRYERERAEIKSRLERVLARLAALGES